MPAYTASPAFLVTDLQMPDLDGLELCRRLRQTPITAKLLIVVVWVGAGAIGSTDGRIRLVFRDQAGLLLPTVEGFEIQGQAALGQSTGQAMAEMERLMQKLPQGVGYEWTGTSLQERQSASQAPLLYSCLPPSNE